GAIFIVGTHHRTVEAALPALFKEPVRAKYFLHRRLGALALGFAARAFELRLTHVRIIVQRHIPPLRSLRRALAVACRIPVRIGGGLSQKFALALFPARTTLRPATITYR